MRSRPGDSCPARICHKRLPRGTYRGLSEYVRLDTGRRMICGPKQMIVRLLDEQVQPWHENASRGGSPGDNQDGQGRQKVGPIMGLASPVAE
jgi:hypothetical protein